MTVLNTETRLVGTGTGLLPRVNLLPPEIAEQRAFRRVQMGLGGAMLGVVGVVALLYVSAAHGVTSAQADLDNANAQHSALQTQATKYANVTALYSAADAAQAQLRTAMGDEVRYSQLLTDLSLSIPSNVWLKSITFAGPSAPSSNTPAAAAAAAAATGPASIGTITVSGTGFSHDDVAAWLESMAGLKTYSSPYFSNSTEVLLGSKTTVTFTGTANLTPLALSGRYLKLSGG